MPSSPLIGGRTDIGEALYIGRYQQQESLRIGHVLPSSKRCRYTFQGAQCSATEGFEVLCKTEFGLALELSSLTIHSSK